MRRPKGLKNGVSAHSDGQFSLRVFEILIIFQQNSQDRQAILQIS